MRNLVTKLKTFSLTFSAMVAMVLAAGSLYLTATPALAATTPTDNKTAVCEGIGLTGSGCDQTNGPSVDSTVKLAISILSFIVGIAAVIMVMIGGFKYITSSGDANNISSAKNTILYAVIGLVIAVLAQVLVRFVLDQAS